MYSEVKEQTLQPTTDLGDQDLKSSYSNRDSDEDDDGSDARVPLLVRVPPDKYRIAYIILYLQGMGTLLPWNFFITANGYFKAKFAPNPTIQETFENSFSVAAMIPNVLSSFLNVYLTHHTNRNRRMISCLILMILCFAVAATFVKVNTVSWTDDFFVMTIILVVVINISSTVFQSAFFGLAGIFGDRYAQALMGGQGLGGTFAALASVVTILGSGDEEGSAFSYFLTAVFIIILCWISYAVLFKLDFVKFHLEKNVSFSSSSNHGTSPIDINAPTDNTVSYDQATYMRLSPPYWKIFCIVSRMALSVCFIFFVTLAVFPSVTSDIESVNKSDGTKWTNELFSPLTCFLLFNLGDLTGRTLAALISFPTPKSWWIPVLSIARVAFIPLFAFCNYHPHHRHYPVFFKADYYPVIFMVIFSVSNGYLGTKCMMYGPNLVPPQHAETAGTIMALFLSSGLALGAGFSFLITTLI